MENRILILDVIPRQHIFASRSSKTKQKTTLFETKLRVKHILKIKPQREVILEFKFLMPLRKTSYFSKTNVLFCWMLQINIELELKRSFGLF